MLTLKTVLSFFFASLPKTMNSQLEKMTTHPLKNTIKSIRELKNYTQEYMADELGITQAGYSKMEKGKTDISWGKLIKIADIFDISPEALLNFDTQDYLKSLNNVKQEKQIIPKDITLTVKKLYEDKINLLELLLSKTDLELKRYREKYGVI